MKDQVSILREKEVKAVVLGSETTGTENKEASEGKYNFVFTQAGDVVKAVKSLRRKFEFKTFSAHKIQIDPFDSGERLTQETDFVGVRSQPYGITMELLPPSHFTTVYFTTRSAGGAGCQILRHIQLFSAFVVLRIARPRIFAVVALIASRSDRLTEIYFFSKPLIFRR